MWINKYKPNNFDDLVLNPIILKKLNYMVDNLQNVIITGNVGVGKTSSVNCLINKIYGKNSTYVYELKMQDDNGMTNLFKNLQTFCKKKILNENLFKVIIINDADDLSVKIQQMINSLIEQFSEKCRFIITCIDSSNIIETIQNKCVIIKFPELTKKDIVKKLKYICQNEGLNYTISGLEILSNGDLRNAILNLQIVGLLYETINEENICKILGIPQTNMTKKIIDLCLDKNFTDASDEILKMKNSGYLDIDILFGLLNFSKSYEKLNDEKKIKYLKIISTIILCVNKGVISDLQLLRCISELCDI